jgi:hypothetical protein
MQQLMATTVCHKYTPEEIQMLADDESKRNLYKHVHLGI